MKKNSSVLLCLLAVNLVAVPLPAPAAGDDLAGQPVRLAMPNNLPVIYFHDPTAALTHVLLAVQGGKQGDGSEAPGLAYMVSRLALEIPDSDDARRMVELGPVFTCEMFGDFSLISMRTLSACLEEPLKVLASGTADPLFSGLRISFVKDQLEFFRRSESDEPYSLCESLHLRHFFGPGGYGASAFGTAETVKGIKKKDLSLYHERHFNAANLVIAVVSDLPREKIGPLLERAFGSLPAGSTQPAQAAPPLPAPARERVAHEEREKQQTLVSLAFLTPAFSAENHALGYLAETLLGRGIESRLWRLRSRLRLSYSVQSRLVSQRGGGILWLSLKVAPDRAEEALAALKREMDELHEQGIGADEWEMTLQTAVNGYMQQIENRERLAFFLAFFECLGAGFRLAADFPRQLRQVTLPRFNEYLKRILGPDNRSQVTIGQARPAASNRRS